MCLHIHAPAAETHSLRLQSQSLFDSRVAAELDLATCAQHSLPGQTEGALQNTRDLA